MSAKSAGRLRRSTPRSGSLRMSGPILNNEEVDFLLEGAAASGDPKKAGGDPTIAGQVVTMKGDLDQIQLTDIFQTLALSKMEGLLRVRNPLEERYVHFKDGRVRIAVPSRVV